MTKNKNELTKRSSAEKLNEILGVESIDDVLNGLTVDKNDQSFSKTLLEIDEHVKNQMEVIQSQNALCQNNPAEFNVHTMQSALNEVSGLIDTSKGIIKHIYNYITTSDLLDPDVISAGAKMIEAARIAVSDYVELYKQQMEFFNKIQLEMIQQKNKKELLDYKTECDIRKFRSINDTGPKTEDLFEYTQESVIKALKAYDKSKIIDAELVN